MTRFLSVLVLGALSLPALAQPAKPMRPNIIFVLCDDALLCDLWVYEAEATKPGKPEGDMTRLFPHYAASLIPPAVEHCSR